MTIRCSECGRGLNTKTETVWTKITGWERHRDQGGTNHVALRKQLEEFMCAGCMTLFQSGLAAGQKSLL